MMTAPQDYYYGYYFYYTLEWSALLGTLENNQLIAPLAKAKVFESSRHQFVSLRPLFESRN